MVRSVGYRVTTWTVNSHVHMANLLGNTANGLNLFYAGYFLTLLYTGGGCNFLMRACRTILIFVLFSS